MVLDLDGNNVVGLYLALSCIFIFVLTLAPETRASIDVLYRRPWLTSFAIIIGPFFIFFMNKKRSNNELVIKD